MQAVLRRISSQKVGLLLRHLTISQRSKSGLSDDMLNQDDRFYKIPTGESDLGDQSRLSFISKDMKESGKTAVASISADGFRLVDGSFMFGPIALFPKTVLSWRVFSADQICERSLELFLMLQPKLDCLVVGAGDQSNVDKVRRNLVGLISKKNIGFEVMATEHAVSTFNFLNSEGRYVAAALFPPQSLRISNAQHGRAMSMIRDSLELDESYIFDVDPKCDGIASLCGRIFGKNTNEAREMETRIRKIQGERIAMAETDELIKEEDRQQRLSERRKLRLAEVEKLQDESKKIDNK